MHAIASAKRILTYFRELRTLLKSYALQIFTVLECTILVVSTNYFFHLSWDHDVLQSAIAETAQGYFFYVFREKNVL